MPVCPRSTRCRLTQNVVDGFGVSGVEGVYRRCCEITLSVLRQHKGSIIRWGQLSGGWVYGVGGLSGRAGG